MANLFIVFYYKHMAATAGTGFVVGFFIVVIKQWGAMLAGSVAGIFIMASGVVVSSISSFSSVRFPAVAV